MAITAKRGSVLGNKPKDVSYETVKNNKSLSEFIEEQEE